MGGRPGVRRHVANPEFSGRPDPCGHPKLENGGRPGQSMDLLTFEISGRPSIRGQRPNLYNLGRPDLRRGLPKLAISGRLDVSRQSFPCKKWPLANLQTSGMEATDCGLRTLGADGLAPRGMVAAAAAAPGKAPGIHPRSQADGETLPEWCFFV